MSRRPPWLRTALQIGITYLIIGLVFSQLARRWGTVWTLAAWAVSGVVFLLHIRSEAASLRDGVRRPAWHAALAAAIGGLGLAVSATVGAIANGHFRAGYVLALVAWPLIVGVPALVAALAVVAIIRRLERATGARE